MMKKIMEKNQKLNNEETEKKKQQKINLSEDL